MADDEGPEIIYHYCGVEAFMEIIKSRTLWLTDLYQTNDAKEGKEIIDVVRAVLVDEKVEERNIAQWANSFARTSKSHGGYGFCMSEDGDVLSQWRGYAQDGMGFSIGFDREKLNQLAKKRHEKDLASVFVLQKVEYDFERQKEAIRMIATGIAKVLKDGAFLHGMPHGLLGPPDEETIEKRRIAFNGLIFSNMMLAMGDRLTIKNKAFKEEKEWRLYAPLSHVEASEKVAEDEVEKHKRQLKYFPRASTIVPYHTFEFGKEGIVKEVICGPQNRTPDEVLRMFLEAEGHQKVEIKHSSAPYLPS